MLDMDNASEFFGSKLPNAYITNVVITKGTITTRNTALSIHTGDGPIITKLKKDGTKVRVQVSDGKSASQQSADSICEITVALYDKVDSSGNTRWANKDFSKNIKLKVLQSTNSKFTDQAKNNGSFTDVKIYSKYTGITVQERTCLLSSVEQAQPAVQCTINGHSALKYRFTFRFLLKGGYSSDLAYFACTYIDMQARAAEFNMNISIPSLQYYMSKVNYQIVYDDGRFTPTKTVIDKTFRGVGGILEKLGVKASESAGNGN